MGPHLAVAGQGLAGGLSNGWKQVTDKQGPADPALRGYEASVQDYTEAHLHLWVSACLGDGVQELDTMIVTAPDSLRDHSFAAMTSWPMRSRSSFNASGGTSQECGCGEATNLAIRHTAPAIRLSHFPRHRSGIGCKKAAVPSGRLADKRSAAYFGKMQAPAFSLP